MLLRGFQWTPTLVLSEVGHGKTKPNRWLERSPKMRNLHRCHWMQKFSKYEKTRKTYRLGSNGPPSVSRGLKNWFDFFLLKVLNNIVRSDSTIKSVIALLSDDNG